jgi:hypothetical protein
VIGHTSADDVGRVATAAGVKTVVLSHFAAGEGISEAMWRAAVGADARWCAGGCVGMAALEAAVALLVADHYQGVIDRASVRLSGTTVTFDVWEQAGAAPSPGATRAQWAMELDGDRIVPA